MYRKVSLYRKGVCHLMQDNGVNVLQGSLPTPVKALDATHGKIEQKENEPPKGTKSCQKLPKAVPEDMAGSLCSLP